MATGKKRQTFVGPDKQLVTIQAYLHKKSGRNVVYWEDITGAFPSLRNIVIMQGSDVVSLARDFESGDKLMSLCIEYCQDEVLEVKGDETPVGMESVYSSSTNESMTYPDARVFSSSSRNRAESSGSFPSTDDSILSNEYTNARGLKDPSHSVYPLDTPTHPENHAVTCGAEHKYQSRGSYRSMQGRHRRSSSHSGQFSHQQEAQYGPTAAAIQRSASTAGPRYAAGPKSTSYRTNLHLSNWTGLYNSRANDLRESMESLWAGGSEPIIQTHNYLQQIESRVQSFGQLMAQGQLAQAQVVLEQAELISQQMVLYHESLQPEIAKNSELQTQICEMAGEADKMMRQIYELQMKQAAADQCIIRNFTNIIQKTSAILMQTYKLHEFPIPRLFIVLQKGGITTTREKTGTDFESRFRLYFLCECGEHTQPAGGTPSALSHHIHLARHEGYDLDRANEFFRKYGFYVLAILQMLKYGALVPGKVVKELDALKAAELDYVMNGLKMAKQDFIHKVNSAIEYLQGLTKAQEQLSHDVGNADSTAAQVHPTFIGKLERLEGVDLRKLALFLKGSDDGMVLGDLYRTVTPKYHVNWVCLDHYRENYGSAVKAFKNTVEKNGGTYGQHTGRVSMHLASQTQAKQFYRLLSTRLVHELELTLGWNAGFEDLQDVKQAVMQSNIPRLVLDLCNNTSPKLNLLTGNHRSEPIINIMAHSKIHTMAIKNITSFLSPIKNTFMTTKSHLRDFDLDELVHSDDNFDRLKKLVHGSPSLERLAIVVSDIVEAFDRLRPLVVEHKALSTLEIRLKDGTTALVHLEKGSDKIGDVFLKVAENWSSLKLETLPMVTSVHFLAKTPQLDFSKCIPEFIKQQRDLKTITVAQLPEGGEGVLQALQRAVNVCSRPMKDEKSVSEKETVSMGADVAQADPDKREVGFLELEMEHRRSMFQEMDLLVASVDGEGTTTETSTEMQGTTAAPPEVAHSSTSAFILSRADGSLASVRFELGQNGSISVVLYIGDFDALASFIYFQASKLTLVGGRSLDRLRYLSKDASIAFSHLKVLEFKYKLEHVLDILHYVLESTTLFPKLKQLLFWNTSDKAMEKFSFPLQEFSLDQTLSKEHFSSLKNLFHTASTLSRVALLIPSLLEAFNIVCSAAKEHGRLSHAQLVTVASRMSIQFIVGTGDVQSISLYTSESDLDPFLSFRMMTELSILSGLKESQIPKLATSVFKNFQHLSMLNIRLSNVHVLKVIHELSQAFRKTSSPCQVILTNFGADSTHVENKVMLPLTTLDITSCDLGDEDLEIIERVFRINQELQQFYVSVKSVDVALRVYKSILQERRPLTTLSLNLPDGPTAVFSFERGSSKEALTVTQKVSQAKLDSFFFLPAADVDRVDIVGVDISTSQAAEIVIYVLRHCCKTALFRFPDLPNQAKNVVLLIEDSIKRGVVSPLSEETVEGKASGDMRSRHERGGASNVEGAVLALYEAFGLGRSRNSACVPVNNGEVYIFWIMRIQPNGMLEQIKLDWSGTDKVTLRLTATPFEESNIARLSSVTELQIPVTYSTTMFEAQINKLVEIFTTLERLDLSCSFSQHLAVLAVALTAASNHKTLKMIEIWHPDRGGVSTAYSLPITSLDLTKHSVPTVRDPLIKSILLASPSLLDLSLTVSDPISAFKIACSKVWSHGSLTDLYLHDKDENTISIGFNSATGSAISVGVAYSKSSTSKLQWDLTAPRMMFSSNLRLEIIGTAQEAALNNPGLRCLTLRNKDSDTMVTIDVPLRTVDLTGQKLSHEHLATLKPFLLSCPLLATLCLTVDPVLNFPEVTRLLQPVFQKLKALTNVRFMLHGGTMASIRFKDDDGSVASVALQVTAKIPILLSDIPNVNNVKKIRICPENPTHLFGIKDWDGLDNILQRFTKLETLEIDAASCRPLSIILYLQHQVQKYPKRPLRRLRQRMLPKSKLATIDLPLRALHLEVERADKLTSTDLTILFLASPLLSELKITLPTKSEIDAMHNILIETKENDIPLENWMIKSDDGYAISVRLEGYSQVHGPVNQALRKVETFEFQVSGSQWPWCFRSSQTSRLIVSVAPKSSVASVDNKNSISVIHNILSLADRNFSCLSYLALTCPINNFFDYLTSVVTIRTVLRFDLLDPTSNRAILSSMFGSAPVVIVFLSEISTQDFLSTFKSIFSAYHLKVEISQHKGDKPEFDISLSRRAGDVNILERVVLDARKVSCKNVLELLHQIGITRTANDGLVFSLKWWIERTSSTGRADGKGGVHQVSADDTLGDSETMAALAKLLAWNVTKFDTNYETMMALIPLVKAEVERDCLGSLKPFTLLRHYSVDCIDESLRADFLKFQSLIPVHAEGSFCSTNGKL